MTDRESLEFAAKAAGLQRCENYYTDAAGNHVEWNPITDDGDALRLAVKCEIDVVQFSVLVRADVAGLPDVRELYNGDPLAATRRAIVRAAAEIGRQMP